MVELTIPDSDRRDQYVASAAQTVFPYTFPVFDQGHLVVQHTVALTGVTTILAITADYTVSGVATASGDVTLLVGAAINDVITIEGDTPIERTTDFQTAGDYRAVTINSELDQQVQMMQQNERDIARAYRLAPEDTSTDLVIPLKDDRKGKFQAYDANGDPIASSGTGADSGLRTDLAASDGVSLVGYISPKAGAVAKTVDDMLRLGGESVVSYMSDIQLADYFSGAGSVDQTSAFISWAAALTAHSKGLIPPGSYSLDTTAAAIGFEASNLTIQAEGALFTQQGTAAVMFDMNSAALPDESLLEHNVRWFGGFFTSSTAGLAGNTNTGIRARGITRGCIAHAYGTENGGAFIEQEARDGFYMYDCHGFNNGRHVYFAAYQTSVSNPQAINIRDCGFSVHHIAGIQADSTISDLNIYNNYFVGKDSIVVETGADAGHGSFNNENINIIGNTFEQGTTGDYYVRIPNTNTRQLHNLNIKDNNFQDPTTKCIQIVNAASVHIDGNRFVSTEAGFIDIGASCTDINFGKNEFQGFGSWLQGLTFACARRQIHFYDSVRVRDVIQLSGWNYGGISTGTGTIDMSTVIGGLWTGEPDTKFLPPKAWHLRVRVEDSGTGANLGIRFAKDVAENAGYGAKCLLDNVTAGEERNFDLLINADDAGDIYWDATASGANTLKVQIMLIGWVR